MEGLNPPTQPQRPVPASCVSSQSLSLLVNNMGTETFALSTPEGLLREHENEPPRANAAIRASLTSPASPVLSGAIHLAWISESLQETGWRRSHEGLLEGGRPSSVPPRAQSSAGRGPTGTPSDKCSHSSSSGMLPPSALVTGGRGAGVALVLASWHDS